MTEQKIISILKKQKKTPISLKELAKKAGAGKRDKAAMLAILERLEEENKLIDQNGRYTLVENLGLKPAEIVKVNATFGFARPFGAECDVFIPGRALMGAMPGDTVLLKPKASSGELPEGEVMKILKESEQKFSGVLRLDGDECVILPDQYVRFPLKAKRSSVRGRNNGEKVLAQVRVRGERHRDHIATVLESFGDAESAAACCAAILAENDIPTEFPLDVEEQARAIAAGEGIHPKELAARLDLRDECIFTIDGADTKDIDDAVSIQKNEHGWELGVHIADVSYYVTYKTPIDEEAFRRGTSVYYADSVVPMLPKELSNGICSLNPNEDRLALSALIRLGHDGKIVDYRFEKTVIRSRIQGVYGEVNKILDGSADPWQFAKYEAVSAALPLMEELAKILTKNRQNRGGVNLTSVESKIVVGADGKAVDIMPRTRGASELIIEEFMLVANEAAARLAIKENLPFVFRVHEDPAMDRLAALYDTVNRLGVNVNMPKGKVSSEQFASLLDKVAGTDIAGIVNALALRSMAKAKYSEGNIGHYGLALDDYCHFTSPIRRYPDLTIHRILSAFVTGMRRDNINKRFAAFAGSSASRSSARELAAMRAERGCEDCYRAEYMQGHVGEEFDGVISSVIQYGCYVRLNNTVEGLVRVEAFAPGDWQFDGNISFVDATRGQRLRLGDKMRVRVLKADVSAGQVDFAPVYGM